MRPHSSTNRFDQVESDLTGNRPGPPDDGPYGFLFGGGGGGTIALAVDQSDTVLTQRGFHLPDGLPDMDAVAAARAHGGRDVRTASLTTQAFGRGGSQTLIQTPVRILTENVLADNGETYAVQIVGDRIAEQRTLDTMLVVLLVGGMVVVLVAFGFGTVYARRALVPIRESLTNQRLALRRQREFAADASHELRTPLTVIRSSVEHLERHRDEPVATVGSALEDIDDEVRHMTAIVEDLLLLARSDSGAVALERVPVDLGDVAADGASAMGKPATDRGVRVEVDPQPAVVAGDPARLRQLVMILVDNAIRHSPTDGRVGVAVRARPAGPRSSSRTTARGSGPRTCRTCSSGSIGRPARPAAGPGWVSRSPSGSSTATAAASRSPIAPRAGPASWSACRRAEAWSPRSAPAVGRSSGQLAGEPVAWAISEAASEIGIAKPRPSASVETAVLMPMTRP